MGLLRGSSMDRSEPALVPEWLRQNHHSSNIQGGLTRSSSFSNRAHHPPFVFGDRAQERESNHNNHRSYPNFGRGGRFERSERDREVPVINRGHDWDWTRERSRVYDGGERLQGSFGDGGRYKTHGSSPRVPPARLEVAERPGLVAPGGEKKFPSWPSNGAYDRKLNLRSSPLPAGAPGRATSNLVSRGFDSGTESESVESHSPSPSPSPSPSFAPAPKMSEALINSTQSQAASENQRLEEIALKQSRQLVPMKPALPKTMVGKPGVGAGDRRFSCLQGAPRDKFKQQIKTTTTTIESKLIQCSSSPVAAAAVAAPAPFRPPPPVAGSNGTKQLLVLKSKNSASSPPVTAAAPSSSPSGNGSSTLRAAAGKARDEERKPLVLSQNRSDFFNAIRKKAAANGENRNPQEINESARSGDGDAAVAAAAGVKELCRPVAEVKGGGGGGGGGGESNGHHQQLKPPQFAPASAVFCGSEEEEMNFLKSLGWVESPEGEDEALTTEEINSFFQKHPSALNQMLRNLSGSSLGSPSSSGSDSDDESRVQSA